MSERGQNLVGQKHTWGTERGKISKKFGQSTHNVNDKKNSSTKTHKI